MRRFVLASALLLPLPFAALPLFSVLFSPAPQSVVESVQVIPSPEAKAQWGVSFTTSDTPECDGAHAPQVQVPAPVTVRES